MGRGLKLAALASGPAGDQDRLSGPGRNQPGLPVLHAFRRTGQLPGGGAGDPPALDVLGRT